MAGKPGEGHTTVVKRGGKKHDHEAHGGAWKVAFADFCLALLCLFLVMWLLAARNAEELSEKLRSAGLAMRESPGTIGDALSKLPNGSLIERYAKPAHGDGASNGHGQMDGMGEPQQLDSPAELRALAKRVEALAEQAGMAPNVQGVLTPQGLRLMLHDTDSTGMFVRGSSLPNERFVELLRKLGPLLAQIRNQLLIVGHTDATKYADAGPAGFSNMALSTERAMAARLHLLEGGMAEASVLQVIGMADRAPFEAAHPNAAVNRRIELLILTTAQAQSMSTMFGAPGQAWPLTDGVDSSMSTNSTLRELGAKPAPARPAAGG
jgi:chemotaxis protein MotB